MAIRRPKRSETPIPVTPVVPVVVVKKKALPILQTLTECTIALQDPALLRTDFDTDEQAPHRDWPRRLLRR